MVPRKRRISALRRQAAEHLPGPRSGRCNALTKVNTRCVRPAGWGTDHAGSGSCWIHDSAAYEAYRSIQRYRGLRNQKLATRLKQLNEIDEDILDLIPDIQLLRSLVIDYVERFAETHDALLAWYADRKQRVPPSVLSLDISQAVQYLDTISRVIERVHRIRERGSISLETFRRVIEHMGIVVARHVRDGRSIEAIEQDWSQLVIDARSATPMLPPGETTTTAASQVVVDRGRAPRRRRTPTAPAPETPTATPDPGPDPDPQDA